MRSRPLGSDRLSFQLATTAADDFRTPARAPQRMSVHNSDLPPRTGHRPRRAALILGLWTLGPVGCAPGNNASSEGPRPNVVIVLIDTLRADRMGLYGYDRDTSPYVDELAEHGVVFEQASSAAPWTLPSVVSMFTSRFIAEHNVAYDGQVIGNSLMTLTEGLSDSGYTTASFLKNPYAGEISGLHRGFDLVERRKGKGQTTGERVSDWLRDAPAGPHFIYVHNSQPHDPLLNRRNYVYSFGGIDDTTRDDILKQVKSYRSLTRTDFVKKRPLGTTDNTEKQKRVMRKLRKLEEPIQNTYSGSVLDADQRIGEIIEALKKSGEWDNTLFMVISDHGEEMNDHGGWQHDQSVYQELVHVPFVVRFPGDEYAGLRVREPVSMVDVLPTVLDYIGREDLIEDASGTSVLPLVENKAATGNSEPTADSPMRVVAMRHNKKKYYKPYKENRGDLNLVVRKGQWKAILNLEHDTVELYDLETDPGEQKEASKREAPLAAEMKAFGLDELKRFGKRAVASTGGGLDGADADTMKELEALGYVGGDEDEDDEE